MDMARSAGAVGERRRKVLVGFALALICLLPLAHGTALISAPYGDSHDGRNGSVWADGAEALRDDAIGSRLGAERRDGSLYANHPPGILLALAAAETVAGDRPTTDRGLILAATAAAIVMTYLLLRACRFGTLVALIGTAAMAATPMIRAYGTMVDTPMLAFPVAVGLVVVAVRLDGKRPLRRRELVLIGCAPLLSWQLMLLCGLIVVGAAVDRARRPHVVPIAVAASIGFAATAAWLLWANGGAGPVVDQWLMRSSVESGVGLPAAWQAQWEAAADLLAPATLTVPVALLLAVQGGRRRWAGLLSVGVVVLYCLLLPDGAAHHEYWAYWVLLPVALGAAHIAEGLPTLLRGRGFPKAVAGAGAAAVLAILFIPAIAVPSVSERINVTSARLPAVLGRTELAAGQHRLWALAEFRLGDRWLEDLDVPIVHLTEAGYRRLVEAGREDDVVIVSTSCTVPFLACDRIPRPVEPYYERSFELLRIGDLVSRRPATR